VNLQTLVALMIVALAVAGLMRGLLRRRKFNFERETLCGCSTPKHSVKESSIVFHARKGERPRIILKAK
jgi:hypothetical protein